jgi:ribosomal protein L29
MLTVEELKKLKDQDFQRELDQSQHELAKVKIQVIDQNKSQNHKIKALKKYIAQIKTIRQENLK